jgi:hypothetical protein
MAGMVKHKYKALSSNLVPQPTKTKHKWIQSRLSSHMKPASNDNTDLTTQMFFVSCEAQAWFGSEIPGLCPLVFPGLQVQGGPWDARNATRPGSVVISEASWFVTD